MCSVRRPARCSAAKHWSSVVRCVDQPRWSYPHAKSGQAGYSRLSSRQNSFTATRRFLVPQILLSAYFSSGPHAPVRFADIGTGLGILPRQLDCPEMFQRFTDDLAWPDGRPRFHRVPVTARFGLDRGSMPDLAWVHACYGRSDHYADLYQELVRAVRTPGVRDAHVAYVEADLVDTGSLARFLRQNKINVMTLSYILYELAPATRTRVLQTLLTHVRGSHLSGSRSALTWSSS